MKSIVDTPYHDVLMSTGLTVRVYPVPETLVWRIVPPGETEPEVPMHEMQTKTGPQRRLAKEGDQEWEPYLRAHAAWDERQSRVQDDARLVLALRESADQPEFDFPETFEPPSYMATLVEDGELVWPKSRMQQRAYWIRCHIAPSANDAAYITDAYMKLSGMNPELVDSFRESRERELRDRLLRQSAVPEGAVQPVLEEVPSGTAG